MIVRRRESASTHVNHAKLSLCALLTVLTGSPVMERSVSVSPRVQDRAQLSLAGAEQHTDVIPQWPSLSEYHDGVWAIVSGGLKFPFWKNLSVVLRSAEG
jgi:hypothetical protein